MAPFSSGFQLSAKKTLTLLPNSIARRKLLGFGGEELVSEDFSTAESFASCLQTTTDLKSLKQVHASILTHGFGNNIYIGSKLLNCYANFDSLAESRWIFGKIITRHLSLWNSAVVGYFRASHFGEVLHLYVNLKSQGMGIDSSAITFSLKSCAELGDLDMGRGIHIDAFKFGLNADKYVGSSLIGLYSKCGDIEDSMQAFEEIFDKDVVAYTAMVTGYAKLSDFRAQKAFGIASGMSREGLDANRVTLVSLLQASGQSEALKEGRTVHCYAMRRGIGLSDEVFETSLVDMYARCGATTVAASVLRQMEIRSVAAWNAMLAGLNSYGKSFEALKFFNIMVKEVSLLPDSITSANILTACSDLNCTEQVTSIHGYLLRRGIHLDLVVTTALIDLYSRSNKLRTARVLFDELRIKDVIVYNVMISGYSQNGEVDEAIRMLGEMIEVGIKPNAISVLSLLSAFDDPRYVRKGRWLHGFVIRNGQHTNIDVSNQILYMYAKWGFIDIAQKIFDSLTEKDLVSWTAMMMGYVNYGQADEALVLFQLMRETGEKPDSVVLITLLQALSQLGCLEKVKEIHGYIHRTCVGDAATINSIIITYAKCGRIDIAEVVFNTMVERGLTSWNTMIAAYGIHGYCRKVLELFHRMPRENLKPDEMTFTSVLSACSHGGLVEEGWNVFNSMDSKYFSIAPKEEHYNCMVDLLGRAGRVEEGYDFVMCTPLNDKTNALCALLAACRVHKNSKLGEVIGRQLLELEPQNSSNYALVSSLYSEDGKWNEAASVRSLARERGLRKMPGYSLIESVEDICGI